MSFAVQFDFCSNVDVFLFLLPDFVVRTFGSTVFSDSGELGILILF